MPKIMNSNSILMIDNDEKYCCLLQQYFELKGAGLDYCTESDATEILDSSHFYKLILLSEDVSEAAFLDILNGEQGREKIAILALPSVSESQDHLTLCKLDIARIWLEACRLLDGTNDSGLL